MTKLEPVVSVRAGAVIVNSDLGYTRSYKQDYYYAACGSVWTNVERASSG